MVLNDLVESFCYSQKNAGLKGLSIIRDNYKTMINKTAFQSKGTHPQMSVFDDDRESRFLLL